MPKKIIVKIADFNALTKYHEFVLIHEAVLEQLEANPHKHIKVIFGGKNDWAVAYYDNTPEVDSHFKWERTVSFAIQEDDETESPVITYDASNIIDIWRDLLTIITNSQFDVMKLDLGNYKMQGFMLPENIN